MTLDELFKKYPRVVNQMLHDFEEDVYHGGYMSEFTEDAKRFLTSVRKACERLGVKQELF